MDGLTVSSTVLFFAPSNPIRYLVDSSGIIMTTTTKIRRNYKGIIPMEEVCSGMGRAGAGASESSKGVDRVTRRSFFFLPRPVGRRRGGTASGR